MTENKYKILIHDVMSYYNFNPEQVVALVPIGEIAIDKSIARGMLHRLSIAFEKQGKPPFKKFGDLMKFYDYHPKVCDDDRMRMTDDARFDTIEEGMIAKSTLPAIAVKYHTKCDKKHIDVIDGRHRLVMSLIMGYKFVPVKFV